MAARLTILNLKSKPGRKHFLINPYRLNFTREKAITGIESTTLKVEY
jgi:hypothetical protein